MGNGKGHKRHTKCGPHPHVITFKRYIWIKDAWTLRALTRRTVWPPWREPQGGGGDFCSSASFSPSIINNTLNLFWSFYLILPRYTFLICCHGADKWLDICHLESSSWEFKSEQSNAGQKPPKQQRTKKAKTLTSTQTAYHLEKLLIPFCYLDLQTLELSWCVHFWVLFFSVA